MSSSELAATVGGLGGGGGGVLFSGSSPKDQLSPSYFRVPCLMTTPTLGFSLFSPWRSQFPNSVISPFVSSKY
jgi:hypothetical protein